MGVCVCFFLRKNPEPSLQPVMLDRLVTGIKHRSFVFPPAGRGSAGAVVYILETQVHIHPD
jgi:hypothetical protein